MTQASQHAWYNGEITLREAGAPAVASISFHLGTGVFDGPMAYWNGDGYYLHRAEDHLVRFRLGAARMGLEFSWSVDDMLNEFGRYWQTSRRTRSTSDRSPTDDRPSSESRTA